MKNNTCGCNKSKQEEQVYILLQDIFPIVERYYCTDEYPWQCDFYIPCNKLYIEYNGMWVHGYKPYIEDDPTCQQQLKKWQDKAKNSVFYQNAIKIWTITDVKKRETAKSKNLNYIEFWTIDDVLLWIKNLK